MKLVIDLLTKREKANVLVPLLLVCEILLTALIILKVPYTEIDWVAYMQEVGEKAGFLSGDWDYKNLRGDTGPLVYPAGFVYLFSALYYLTDKGAAILTGQYIFLGLYTAFMAVVFKIYTNTKLCPPWVMVLLCASRRIHSIFVLRLFNDCFALFFLYISVYLFIKNRWSLGCFFFSLGVSIKMNVLLFAPSLLLLLWLRFGFWGTIPKLGICATLQVVLALPFLYTQPVSYFRGAFDFGRQFMYKWTVNWRFVDEETFLSSAFARGLLALHLTFLFLFLSRNMPGGVGVIGVFRRSLGSSWQTSGTNKDKNPFSSDFLVALMFGGAFIGILFCRSLHFQFYVWYFHTLPFLLFLCPFPSVVRVLLLVSVEVVWNIYPPRPAYSFLLFMAHCTVAGGVLYGAPSRLSAVAPFKKTR